MSALCVHFGLATFSNITIPCGCLIFFKHCCDLHKFPSDHWPVHAWFLEITLVWTSVCVCVCVCSPRAMKNHSREMTPE